MTDLVFLTEKLSTHPLNISSAELSVIFPTQPCLTEQKDPQAASEV